MARATQPSCSPGRSVLGRAEGEWVTRTWTLVAWTFLTAVVLVGGLRSSEVLGWGGYWAWDPDGNAVGLAVV